MAYNRNANFLEFFVPALALASADGGVMKAMDIGAASADAGEYVCVKPCMLYRGQFTLTEEAASGTTTAPTVVMKKRPTPLSSTGQSTIGTITVPSGTAIGKTVYKDIEPVQFNVGDSLHLSWTVGVGTPTGIGLFSALCHESDKTAAENSDMVASS